MSRILSVVLLVALSAFGALAQDTTKPAQNPPAPLPKIPDEAKKQPNPVKSTPDSIAEGKKEYGTECAMCHGDTGDGKGDLASDMKAPLPDLRDPASLKGVTDGEIYYVIKKGKGEMPGEEGRLKDNDIWNIVNYVRSIPKKEAVAK